MLFKLDEKQYNLLKTIDFSEINGSFSFDDATLSVEVSDDAVGTFQVIISEEIDVKGLSNNQDEVTPYGRKLYALYDEITYQKHHNKTKR